MESPKQTSTSPIRRTTEEPKRKNNPFTKPLEKQIKKGSFPTVRPPVKAPV